MSEAERPFLERTGLGLRLRWEEISIGQGIIELANGRSIEVGAVNQFNNITAEAARALIRG